MIRKSITTLAAAAVIIASFAAVPAAEAASKRERVIAGVALGVAAVLLGAEVEVRRNGHHSRKGHHDGRSGGKHQRQGFRADCEDVPVFGGRSGTKVIGFHRVCN